MRGLAVETPQHPCPYLDLDDPRCSRRLTLVNLSQAFSFCLGAFERCKVYQQIRRETQAREPAQPVARSA